MYESLRLSVKFLIYDRSFLSKDLAEFFDLPRPDCVICFYSYALRSI
jgi:hypothetical protein